MYKIIVKGPAGESNVSDRKKLDGIDCQDEFSEYFHEAWNIGGKEDRNQQNLIDKGVSGGYMRFEYEHNKLYVIVEYNSDEKLNDDEIEELKDYTQGQLSDGIGEGFEQQPVMYENDKEIFISPWFRGQKLKVEQIEDDTIEPKKKVAEDDNTYWEDQCKKDIEKMNALMDELKKLLDKDKK
jgi:hypothetical protein